MRSECKHQLDPAKRPMPTQSSRWVGAVEKKRDRGESLIDDDAAVNVCHATGAQCLREGSPLDLTTIEDLLRFHVAVSRGRIDDKRIAVYSVNTFAENTFIHDTDGTAREGAEHLRVDQSIYH